MPDYNIFQWYALFCGATTVAILWLNLRAYYHVRPPMGFIGAFTYFSVTGVLAFVFAPVFFVVFIKFSEIYVMAVATVFINKFLNDDE